MRTVHRLVVAGVLLVVPLTSCSSDEDASPTTYGSVGERIYDLNCKSCHGAEGAGGFGPKLADGAVVEAFPDIEDQIAVIVEGRGSMPAWDDTLTPEEIRAVAEYERGL